MGIFRGPGVVNDGLVFGFDTGYPISDNAVANRFNQGEPTVNLITNSGTSNTGWVGYGWTGSQAISSDYSNTYEFTATNGWHNRTFDTGVTSGGTIYVNFEYKLKQQQTTQNQLFVLNGTHLGSYTNYIGAGSMSFEWKTFSGSFTANTNSSKIAIGPRGADGSGLTDIVYIRNLQVESKAHATPFVNGTRSDTASLIDLKRTASIDVSDVSFDSNAQPTFDGTNDKIVIPADSFSNIGTGDFTIDLVFKNTKTSNYSHFFSIKDQYHFALKMQNTSSRGIYVYRTSGLSTYGTINAYAPSTTDYYHLVCKREGDNIELYLNGVSKGTKSGWNNIDIENDTYTTSIGTHTSSGSEFLAGEIPVVKVYNRALTSGEIADNFKAYKNRFNI